MNVPGHLATAYLLPRRGGRPRLATQIAPSWLGALLPDLVDKPIKWLGVTPYGRTIGHSALLWALMLGMWLALGRPRLTHRARWFDFLLLGGLSHLAADLIDDIVEGIERSGYVFSAWFGWPLTNPDMWNVASPHLLEPIPYAVTSLELATVAACLWHVALYRG